MEDVAPFNMLLLSFCRRLYDTHPARVSSEVSTSMRMRMRVRVSLSITHVCP
jgi:hypothetical protein